MEKNEIKKLLYKENPKAILTYIRERKAYYISKVNDQTINFEIPVEDMGTADFLPEMDSKLLNRWILIEA
jgi:hypothetical protein